MKNENGITLLSLVTYIAVMLIVLVVMNSIITNFYSNNKGVNSNVQEVIEFNKFNSYFLKEIKSYNNFIDSISNEHGESYVLFNSGNSFLYKEGKIFYNNLIICNNLKNAEFKNEIEYKEDDQEVIEDTIINVTLEFENFKKTMKYKVENIY